MTIQQLKYIIRVVEKESISEAAMSLFISQPSLSNAIKEVEKEYNIILFLRNNKGVVLTPEGKEFVQYAKQILVQSDMLEERYLNETRKKKFSISSQHYPFVVESFMELLKKYDSLEYDFSLKETKTVEIIEDVKLYKSEIGVIYLSSYNEKVITKMLKEAKLSCEELFVLKPKIFVSKENPLCRNKTVHFSDLENYPYISFDQGENSSFYLSEEIFSNVHHKREIKVSDRATMTNMIVGLNGYTIGSGLINEKFENDLATIPLEEDILMHICVITNNLPLSKIGEEFINIVKNYM